MISSSALPHTSPSNNLDSPRPSLMASIWGVPIWMNRHVLTIFFLTVLCFSNLTLPHFCTYPELCDSLLSYAHQPDSAGAEPVCKIPSVAWGSISFFSTTTTSGISASALGSISPMALSLHDELAFKTTQHKAKTPKGEGDSND